MRGKFFVHSCSVSSKSLFPGIRITRAYISVSNRRSADVNRVKRYFLIIVLGLKFITVDRPFAETHYADLSSKPFFIGLVDYIISGPVVAMVWEGKGVVATGRKIIGATNPAESAPGTIRGDYAIDIGR